MISCGSEINGKFFREAEVFGEGAGGVCADCVMQGKKEEEFKTKSLNPLSNLKGCDCITSKIFLF